VPTPELGDHVIAGQYGAGRITWISERTAIVTRDLVPGSVDRLLANPSTPLVGHPWTSSVEVPVTELRRPGSET
jgi:hypothetical protein